MFLNEEVECALNCSIILFRLGKLGYNGASAHAGVPNAGKKYAGGLFVHTGYKLLGSIDGKKPPADLWKEHREW